MSILSRSLLATAVAGAMTWNIPAHGLSLHECGVKYRAGQTAKTLNGMSWKEFHKAEYEPGTAAATAPAAAPTLITVEPSKSTRVYDTARIYHTAPTNGPKFPTAVSPKYARQSAGRGRMLTCLDQYKANNADHMNGGLRWMQKGGGYYSKCNRHLKGAGA
jgi:hypothetical protein